MNCPNRAGAIIVFMQVTFSSLVLVRIIIISVLIEGKYYYLQKKSTTVLPRTSAVLPNQFPEAYLIRVGRVTASHILSFNSHVTGFHKNFF